MKDQILKIAKVKSEKEFYKKYPTEEAFMKAHGKEFKKAAMGTSMVKKQLTQLTDFSNPPQAGYGTTFMPLSYKNALDTAGAINAGLSVKDYVAQENLRNIQAPESDGGLGDIISIGTDVLGKLGGGGSDITSAAGELGSGKDTMLGGLMGFENGGEVPQAQWGAIAGTLGKIGQGSGGIGNLLVNTISGDSNTASNVMKGVGQNGLLGQGGAGLKSLGNKAGLATAGKAAGLGILNAAPGIIGGIGQMQQQKANLKAAEQSAAVSGVVKDATLSKPKEVVKHNFTRPEDNLVQPGQLGAPGGTGTNFLQAQDGTSIGGNPTEVQNTYVHDTLYSDLGYEPLNDSNVKQYQLGGALFANQNTEQLGRGRFQNGGDIPVAEFGDYFQDTGQASIGKGVGSAIGSVFGGPLGGAIGGFIGKGIGNLFGGARDAERLKRFQETTKRNTEETANAQMAEGIQAQNAAYMEDGGYVSNNWQPQVIAHFGEYKVSDLFKPDPTMDTLRSGGHIRSNHFFDTDAYPAAQDGLTMAMGGDLKIHWGGDAQVLSNNPYVGEIVQFQGKDHEESAGKGRTGMGVTYGDRPVEVEGGGKGNTDNGEIAVKLKDGGEEESLNIYGNIKINKELASLIGDDLAVGKKFKTYAKDIADNDIKQKKVLSKAAELADGANPNNIYDQLKLNSANVMVKGANAKQKSNAKKLSDAALIQNSLLDVAKARGVDPNEVFEAKYGKKISKAQDGGGFSDPITHEYVTDMGYGDKNTLPDAVVYSSAKKRKLDTSPILQKRDVSVGDSVGEYLRSLSGEPNITPKKKSKIDWKLATEALLSGIPFGNPTNQAPMDPNQILPEQLALANNQLESVQAQQFRPMLQGAPSDISLQDQINAIDAQARAATRNAGSNPEAQYEIFSKAAQLKTQVLGEQFRLNQAEKSKVYTENRQAMNQGQLQNLQILDNQYLRQQEAKSKTKAQALEAVKSMVAKEIQHTAANKKLAVLENMYNYRFTPQGQAYSINPAAQWNSEGNPTTGQGGFGKDASGNTLYPIYDKKTHKVKGYTVAENDTDFDLTAKNGKKIKGKNSSIVKAFKNL